ncbi:hypothetical protein K450DRAFT_217692 [Umbelopsis ramanniana AG]|uniref:4-nitrophenylphosphatase n=1 Tax=Umbelopsis ramanniana AG TaxID=1314678 RepID=A0AAD5EJ80_UMBRA|nr:uncharacterized protein K450DRAFT_217692 [Umbelopsis ramanniana AG]KAI8584723.1 hypothetical protein K450DRAFT_217692 [Umbelopsis ramanniana AG]
MEKLTTAEQLNSFIDSYDNFLFDCDGVLWEGSNVFPNVREAMQLLRTKGKRIFFVTNNSTKSREAYLDKFKKLDIEAHLDEIFSSAFATAAYLKNVVNFPADKKVYIVGMSGISEELKAEGIRSFGGVEDDGARSIDDITDDPEVGAVVMGLDVNISYYKYCKAFTFLHNHPERLFLLTNADSTFPTHGTLFPGAGAIASPLITALERKPDAILGKPAQNMLEAILAEYSLDPTKSCMIGDRLDTDIDFGNRGGLTTLCVLTGVTREDKLLSDSNPIKATFYVDSFGDFASLTGSTLPN